MKSKWLIPGAIIVAGAILAIPVYKVNHHANVLKNGDVSALRPISANDHILGKPSAPVIVVEYADIDSAYAKDFQKTMEELMQEYGTEGNVAWVFRHLPLIGQNAYSEQHAEAAECAASLSSTPATAFFSFIDKIQAATPGDSQFNPSDYPAITSSLGITASQFDACLKANTFQKRVADDYQNGMDIGATGSPYSVLIVKGQKPVAISGSVPSAAMKKIIDTAISQVLQAK